MGFCPHRSLYCIFSDGELCVKIGRCEEDEPSSEFSTEKAWKQLAKEVPMPAWTNRCAHAITKRGEEGYHCDWQDADCVLERPNSATCTVRLDINWQSALDAAVKKHYGEEKTPKEMWEEAPPGTKMIAGQDVNYFLTRRGAIWFLIKDIGKSIREIWRVLCR